MWIHHHNSLPCSYLHPSFWFLCCVWLVWFYSCSLMQAKWQIQERTQLQKISRYTNKFQVLWNSRMQDFRPENKNINTNHFKMMLTGDINIRTTSITSNHNYIHTCWAIKMLVSVRNNVTNRPTLAAMEFRDIRKLINDAITIAIHGR